MVINNWSEVYIKHLNKFTIERMLAVMNLSIKYKVLTTVYGIEIDKNDLLWDTPSYDETLYKIPTIGWETLIDALEVKDEDSAVAKIVKFAQNLTHTDLIKLETNIYLNDETLEVEDMDVMVKKIKEECVA